MQKWGQTKYNLSFKQLQQRHTVYYTTKIHEQLSFLDVQMVVPHLKYLQNMLWSIKIKPVSNTLLTCFNERTLLQIISTKVVIKTALMKTTKICIPWIIQRKRKQAVKTGDWQFDPKTIQNARLKKFLRQNKSKFRLHK